MNRHAPVFDDVAPVMLNWTARVGEVVARVSARDADSGPNAGNVTYSLVSPVFSPPSGISDGLGVFDIAPTTGVVTLTSGLLTRVNDFSEILLTIRAQDQGSIPLSATTVLSVVLIPVPNLVFNGRIRVPENTPENSNLTEVRCEEQGRPSNSLSLSIQGNYSRFFAINTTSSQLTLVRKLDYESFTNRSNPFYRLNLICQNQFGRSDKREIEIEVENVDDNPFIFSRNFYSASVPENAQIDTSVVQITASDADLPDGMVTYTLVNTDRHFTVGTVSGEIMTVTQFDREERDAYSFMVRAELNGSNAEVVVNISISDINDEIPVFVRQPYIISNLTTMSEIGDLLVTVAAEDPDLGENGQVTYALENNSFFVINETTGAVYVDSVLQPNQRLALVVLATDGGDPELMSNTTIHIFVRPSPESVKFTQTRFNFNVEEDEPRGALIGRVEAFIIDDSNTTLNNSRTHQVSYSIINGSDNSLFTIISTTGEIYLLSSLDFDLSASQYVLTVQASHEVSNGQILTGEAYVVVEVSDVNDNPPQFSPAAYAVAIEEFTPANTTIVHVSAMDIDSGSDVTYFIDGDDAEPFQIDAQSGVISNRQELLIARDYRFFVTAFDGELSSMAVVFISVTRSVSVEPTFTREQYIFSLLESSNRGSYVGTVEAVTRGNLSSLDFAHFRFRIVRPDPVAINESSRAGDTLFHVDAVSGNISTLTDFEFDAENRTTYVFYVQVYSNIDDTVYDRTTVEVELADANDNSPVFAQPLYTRVIENSVVSGSTILNVSASDRDSTTNSEITYSIEPLSFDFTIDHASGEITVTGSSLAVRDHHLTVVATDKGSPPLNGTATVVIAIIPAAPSSLVFTEPIYYFMVPEDAEANTLVGVVRALDAATNLTLSSITYSTSNLSICLHVGEDDGEIRVSCGLDREVEPRYELQILASDRDASGYGTVIVEVLDVNDNSPQFLLDIYAEVINDQFGNEIAIVQVNARDPDNGRNGTVSYFFIPTEGAVEDVSIHFRIDAGSGEVYLLEPTIPIGDYRLTVQASDSGLRQMMSSTALVLVCVTRARPSVFFFNASATLSVEENQPPRTTVGQVVLLTTGGRIDPSEFTNNLHFSIVGGDSLENITDTNDSLPLFDIVPDTGIVYTLTSLDRETAAGHVIVVLANFTQFGLAEQASLNIRVIDQNDVQPLFEPMRYSDIIEENTINGTTIFNVTVVDEDIGLNAEVELSFSEDLVMNPFGIRVQDIRHPYTYGEIFVQDSNFLTPGQYDFEIVASDRGTSHRQNGTARVFITVEHSLPEFLSFPPDPYVFDLIEESPRESFVGNVSIEQPITPALEGLVYSIEGGTGERYFGIDGSSGAIRSLRSIDREVHQQFNLTIMAQLPSEPLLLPVMTTIVINITDINDNVPMFSSGSYSATILTSDLSTDISLVRVSVADADIGSNAAIVLSVVDMSPHGHRSSFYIRPNGDIFTNTTNLNVTTYHLNVTARDLGTPSQSGNAIVTIVVQLPVPDEIRFAQPRGYVFNISENLPSGDTIGEIGLESVPDHVVQFITFTDNSADFQAVRVAGDIRAGIQTLNMYDYEMRQNYTFQVEARLRITTRIPSVDLRTTVEVTVLIIDENDNPPVFANFPPTLSYLENRTNEEMIYLLRSTDADSGMNAVLRYEILNRDIRDKFRINSDTGELYLSASVDREERQTYEVTVQVSDSGNPRMSVQNTTTFTLLDINDNIPRMTSGFTFSVRERVGPPRQLVQLMGADPDVGNNGTFQFTKVQTTIGSTNQSPGNPVVNINANGSVQLARELDYEQTQSYTIHVRVTDQGSPPLRYTYTNVTLQVINEPDNMPQFVIPGGVTIYQSTIVPRQSNGDTVAQVNATDADPGDTISYHVTSINVEGNNGNQPAFRMDARTGRIYSNDTQSLMPEANFTINVTAYDNSQFNFSVTTVVNITVVPERLQFTQATYTVQLSEDSSVASEVTRIPLQPLSASSHVQYRIDVTHPVGQSGIFSVFGRGQPQAVLRLASEVDREAIDSYTVVVTAQRSGEPDTTATVFINVTDVNDNRPIFIDPPNTVIRISELTTSNVIISRVNATDVDIGENSRLQYIINNRELGLPFSLDRNNGDIEVSGNLDYETRTSYSFTVLVMDSGTNPRRMQNSQDYTVQLINKNDNAPQFSAAAYFGEIYVGAPVDEYVRHALIQITDEDDPSNEQELFFRIYFPADSTRSSSDYAFEVDSEAPHFIRVVHLPDGASVTDSQLLEFLLEVSDGFLASTVRLFISVFTSSNLISFRLSGVSGADLLSCQTSQNSICGFRDALSRETERRVNSNVQFYNNSIQRSPDSLRE